MKKPAPNFRDGLFCVGEKAAQGGQKRHFCFRRKAAQILPEAKRFI
jgi:hypothetical protein